MTQLRNLIPPTLATALLLTGACSMEPERQTETQGEPATRIVPPGTRVADELANEGFVPDASPPEGMTASRSLTAQVTAYVHHDGRAALLTIDGGEQVAIIFERATKRQLQILPSFG